MAPEIDVEEYAREIRAGSRSHIARAITLVESRRPDHEELAGELLELLTPFSGGAARVGISGVPGAGKSTFIDALGMRLVDAGHRVAVLAVDPSSTRTGGSILGDRTRMTSLATSPSAFVRPSPTSGVLGGVARATREAMHIMEAAGYDVVLVETVGVGQSEVSVANMVDTFLLLALARSGDQLQGIKRGILEIADVVAVNKADGEHAMEAKRAARELAGALRIAQPSDDGWRVPVLACSALTGDGLDEVWSAVEAHRSHLAETGELATKRADQEVDAVWSIVADRLLSGIRADAAVRAALPDLEAALRAGSMSPTTAAARLLALHDASSADTSEAAHLDATGHTRPGGAAADFWEERYASSDKVWSGRVNAVLADVAQPLDPGSALDLGCGEGADAIWLAQRGWQVVGIDISPTAVARAASAARAAGLTEEQVSFRASDLSGWSTDGPFDLVTASFLHSPVELSRSAILRQAARLVAQGGHLLVLSHAAAPPWADPAAHEHHFLTAEEEVAELALSPEEWTVVLAEQRSRDVTAPDGSAAHLEDSVVLMRRR